MGWSPRVEQLEPRTLLALTPFDLGQLLVANGGDGSDGVVFQAGNSGDAVSNLGDISGDDIDDYAVAAPGSAVAGNPGNSGQTFVVFGSGAGFGAEFDLTTLNGTNGFVAAGVDNGERSGEAIAAAGDVNNDGIDDFIISTPQADPNALNNAGRTYVVFGRDVSVDPFPAVFQLSSLLVANGGDGANGFVANGVAAGDLSGNSVGGEGDFNGDLIPDVIIGAPNADHNGNNAGASYVVFGRDAAANPFPAEIELSSLLAAGGGDGSDGVVIHGTAEGDLSGISVSPAGDFNNDGFGDIVIGAHEANSPGGFNEEPGESYLLFGRDAALNPFPAEFFLSDLLDINGGNGTDGVVFIGINSFFAGGDHLGRMVGSAGDINNDGFDDLLLGAPDANQDSLNGPGAKGEVYIIFGRSDVSATLGAEFPLADLLPAGGGDGSQGIVFPGVDFGDNSGASLAPVGDVNDDGIDDLIIGAQGGTPHGSRSGEAYVFFGSAAPMPAVFDVNNLDGFNGLILHGIGPLDDTGGVQLSGTVEVSAISGGGDLNDDGIDDLIIGAPGRNESFVVFGGNLDGNGIVEPVPYSFDLGDLLPSNGGDGTRGFAIHSDESISDFGTSVNTVGDVNNDGIDDFIIGDPPSGGGFRGRTFVIFGSTTPFPAELSAGDVDGTNGFFLRGIPGGNFDGTGIQVAGAGDVNGDGIGDLIASTVDGDEGGATANTGQVYVIFGRDTSVTPFPQEIALETLLPANGGDGSIGFVIRGVTGGDNFGTGLDGVGDFNNDGFDDIIIGAWQAETFSGVNNSGETYAIFGRDGSVNPFGAIFEASSLAAVNGGDGSAGLVIKGIDVNDRSGVSANGAGDFNNDGIDDVIIGASSSLNSEPGEFYVLFGFDAATNPLGAEFDLSDLLVGNGGDGSQGFVGLGNVNGDRTGTSVNGAGDINDDGFDDIIVSAPNANSNASGDDKGETYVIFGRSDANSIGAEFSVSSLLPGNGGDGTDGFVLPGINFGDQLGGAVKNAGDVVSAAGDVNNDGFADIIVGASRATPHGTQSGQSYLLLGSGAPFPAIVELSSLTNASGVAFNGFQVNEESGDSVGAAGDINNDGFGDLLIGAQNAKTGTFQTGRVYVVYGGPFGCSTTVTNTDNSGSGSLRAAIECANFLPTLDTIDFDIPGPGPHTILLIGDLPTITDRTIIDGTTEPGYAGTPVVQLLSGFNTNGFDFAAGGTVRGMEIYGFGSAVHITSGAGYTIENNTFSENGVAIDVQNASDLTVRDNTITKDEATGLAATGIQLFDTAGTNIVRDNVISFSAASGDNPFIEPQGINLRGTGSFTVTNNDVSIPLGVDGVGFTVSGQVSIVFGEGNSVTGGRNGIYLAEVFGDVVDDSLNDFQFIDQSGDFVTLDLGFMQGPQILDATNVVFGDATLSPPGRANTFDAAQRMHLEDKLFHFPDDPGVGLIMTVGQDFGDAPTAAQSGFASDYPTVVFASGASHLDAGPRLGPLRDIESDGQPAAGAMGDDNDANGDDEDGVAFLGSLAASPTSTTTGSVRVDLQNADGTANRLDAFIDFNQNGSWADPGEQIFTDFDLGTADGVQVLNFTVPQVMGGNVLTGTTFARFRLSTAGGLAATGAADDGEVEDLPVAICSTAVTNTNDSGDGSLRAAIQCANAVPGVNTISFDIAGAGPHTIGPQSPLPTITDPVIIDGTTQGVSPTPLVELDGTLAGSGASGLTIGNGGDGSTVRGLAINRFDVEGILISRRDNVLIEDNHLGTDPSGTVDLGNGQSGIHILNGKNNTVRGNVISGNDIGVVVEGRLSTGNVIAGNLIGTDATGTQGLKNRLVNVDIADAPANTIGGTGAADGNVIAGSRVGIFLRGDDATGNLVQGNRIGTNAAGTEKILNNRGIEIKTLATGNTIGGAGSAGNQISGNTKGILINSVENNMVLGNLIGTDASGNAALGNVRGVLISGGTNNQIGSEPNVISGNVRDGLRIFGAAATGNVVGGNLIGTNAAGDEAIPNRNGILISSNASGNTIGGMTEAARNVISGNSDAGVFLTSDSNSVIGNFIGTDADGAAAVGNETGVFILRSEGQTIGGAVGSGAGNLISGNSEEGVLIKSGGATANTILGNLIGTDADGTAALGNKHGVRIESDLNTIGGATPDDGNVISGNTQNGVYLLGAAATGNLIQSNRIGINAVGTEAVANARSGVLIEDAPVNTIGGPSLGNAIGGNTQQGIRIAGLGATGNLVQGNSIGFDAATVIVIANRDGVRVADGASGNTIGGQAIGEANEVAGNTGRGVWINDGTANSVTRNSIHNNAALGISIGGTARTPNDPDDPDVGANRLQNFPEIATAVLNGGMLDIEYSIPSHTDNSAFPITVEFFLADSDGEEGETFLGQHSYSAQGTAIASINAGAAQNGSLIVATATDADGNTSEFSAAATVSELLLAAGGQAGPESRVEGQELTASDLQPIVGAAIDRFVAAGFGSDLFDRVEVTIADLPGAALGMATGNTITIDVNAAGHGWFVDITPLDDSEFLSGSRLSTLDSRPHMDLLTVVMHELGHVAGLDDLDDPDAADDLMYGWLDVGQRKTSLAASIADDAFAALADHADILY